MSAQTIGQHAQKASRTTALLSTEAKNTILLAIAERLEEHSAAIIEANEKDLLRAKNNNLEAGFIDRLTLDEKRIAQLVKSIQNVITLKDYVGELLEARVREDGLSLKRVRVPLGVILMIYEARPNVTVDAACLALKSGNAVILKGGSEALETNKKLVEIMRSVLAEIGGTEPEHNLVDAVQLISGTDRNLTHELLQLDRLIDVVIPRGGKGLINFVKENSRVPIIETGASVVHTYIHEAADISKAVAIAMNAKLRRTSICNTLDTLIVDSKIAGEFLAAFLEALDKNPYHADHLEIRADENAYALLKKNPQPHGCNIHIKKAMEEDFDTEFLDYILAIKTVNSFDEALAHIRAHSLKHSEAIVTEQSHVAEQFIKEVDAACVYWNASTQFSDGGEFGLGAEIGISTQKLHVRGPFALEGLTTYKWIVEGNGHIR
ncbi:glutamate-5-semialdehyde dehydrogenase [Candidatus Gracilibacteria bacterium]|nr:glutamate-5-semialdehyde dehydrogenase [Candidatus Gracilibacteria bacterium]